MPRRPANHRTSLKPVKPYARIRIIIDDITLYMPAGIVDETFGNGKQREAVLEVLALIDQERGQGVPCGGIATTVGNVNVQVDVL